MLASHFTSGQSARAASGAAAKAATTAPAAHAYLRIVAIPRTSRQTRGLNVWVATISFVETLCTASLSSPSSTLPSITVE